MRQTHYIVIAIDTIKRVVKITVILFTAI